MNLFLELVKLFIVFVNMFTYFVASRVESPYFNFECFFVNECPTSYFVVLKCNTYVANLKKNTCNVFWARGLSIWKVTVLGILYEVSTLWHMSFSLAGGHLNPAVTFALCLLGRERWRKFPVYFAFQTLGAFLGSAIIFGMYYGEQWLRARSQDQTKLTLSLPLPLQQLMLKRVDWLAALLGRE